MKRPSTFIAITLLLASAYGDETNGSYVQRIQAGRIEKEAGIKSEHGLLSYIGSYPLKEGENRVGSDPVNEIRLPVHSAPAQVGKFILLNGHVTFTSSAPGLVSLNGRSVSTVELTGNGSRPSATLSVGRLQLIYRLSADQHHRVFISDPQSPNFANFHGLDWYPIDAAWRIKGKFVPNQSRREIAYENALGGRNIAVSPGDVLFTSNKHEYRLEVEMRTMDCLFFFPMEPVESQPMAEAEGCKSKRGRRCGDSRLQSGGQPTVRRESVYGVLTFAFAKPFAIADYRRRKDPADPGRTRGGSSKKIQ